MLKKVLPLVLLAFTLTFAACSTEKEDEPTANTGSGSAAPSPELNVIYQQGFHDLEREGANSWRWMSDQGVIKLKNTKKDMSLHIVGDVPLDALKEVPTYKITFNGEVLEELSAKSVDKEYVIPAAKQGAAPTSELTITSNKYFIPKQLDPKSNDERKLSFSLRQLTWESK